MSDSYLVKAPYVTLQVPDLNGVPVVLGYYAGAVVEDPVKGDVLDKHVRTGLVEKVSGPKAAFGPGAEVPEVTAPVKKTASSSKS
jgi:hypothetical protein